MHHTLFMTFGRVLGLVAGDPYRGFILLDMLTSAVALVSAWWMLRAIVRPATAAAAALVLGVGPVFWGYGAMAGNYTAIVVVGSLLLGIAYRGRSSPQAWQPFAAAIVLAIGTGYRQDIGRFLAAGFRRDPLATSLEARRSQRVYCSRRSTWRGCRRCSWTSAAGPATEPPVQNLPIRPVI